MCSFPLPSLSGKSPPSASATRSQHQSGEGFGPGAPRLPGFVRRLHSYYGGVRLLMIVHHRLRLLAFPTRTSAASMLALADHEISRFPSKERAHMPVSKTTPGRLGARVIAPIRVAFRQRNDVGTQDEGTFAAQWLAYALPCQRFANTLAGICA